MNMNDLITRVDDVIDVLEFARQYRLDFSHLEHTDDPVALIEKYAGVPESTLYFLGRYSSIQKSFDTGELTLEQITRLEECTSSVARATQCVLSSGIETTTFCSNFDTFLGVAEEYCKYDNVELFSNAVDLSLLYAARSGCAYSKELILSMMHCLVLFGCEELNEDVLNWALVHSDIIEQGWFYNCKFSKETIDSLTDEDVKWLIHTDGLCSLSVPQVFRDRCYDYSANQCYWLQCAGFTELAFENLNRMDSSALKDEDGFTTPLAIYATLNCKEDFLSWFSSERKIWSKYRYSRSCLLQPSFYMNCIDINCLPVDGQYDDWTYFNPSRKYTYEEARVLCRLDDVADALYSIGFTLDEIATIGYLNKDESKSILDALDNPGRMEVYNRFRNCSSEVRLSVLKYDYSWNEENIKYAEKICRNRFKGEFSDEIVRVLNNSHSMQKLMAGAHLKAGDILRQRFRLWDAYASGLLDTVYNFAHQCSDRGEQVLYYLFRQWALGTDHPVHLKYNVPEVWRAHRKFDFDALQRLYLLLQQEYKKPDGNQGDCDSLLARNNWKAWNVYDVASLLPFFNEDHLVEFTTNGARLLMIVGLVRESGKERAVLKVEFGDCSGLEEWYSDLDMPIVSFDEVTDGIIYVPDCATGSQIIPWTTPIAVQSFCRFW